VGLLDDERREESHDAVPVMFVRVLSPRQTLRFLRCFWLCKDDADHQSSPGISVRRRGNSSVMAPSSSIVWVPTRVTRWRNAVLPIVPTTARATAHTKDSRRRCIRATRE